jgi:hypothetical protein
MLVVQMDTIPLELYPKFMRPQNVSAMLLVSRRFAVVAIEYSRVGLPAEYHGQLMAVASLQNMHPPTKSNLELLLNSAAGGCEEYAIMIHTSHDCLALVEHVVRTYYSCLNNPWMDVAHLQPQMSHLRRALVRKYELGLMRSNN